MQVLTRAAAALLSIIALVAAGIVVMFLLTGTVWTASASSLQMQATLDGPNASRQLAAGVAAAVALVIAIPALIGAFMRPHTVTVWLNGQQAVPVPEETVERYIGKQVSSVRGVEDAHIHAKSRGERSVAIDVDLLVAPDTEAGAVTARVEDCISAALVSSCGIVLDRRPSISVRHATSAANGRGRQAA